MTAAEIVVAEAGVFLLASEALAAYVVLRVSERAREVAGEAVRAARQAVGSGVGARCQRPQIAQRQPRRVGFRQRDVD